MSKSDRRSSLSSRRVRNALLLGLLSSVFLIESAGNGRLTPVQIRMGTLSVSKLPFAIAEREGLYAKYGLDADFWVTPANSKYGVVREWLFGAPDIRIDGATPQMVDMVEDQGQQWLVFIAGTDCLVRAHIIGRPGLSTLADLEGGRIGISTRDRTTTGFVAIWLARRMGWVLGQDLTIVTNARDVAALDDGRTDAIVATEFRYERSMRAGYPILEDTRDWDLPIAGNSVKVPPDWLNRPESREVTRRFLMATIEALAIFHEDRERTLQILESWPTVADRAFAETVYERGSTISRTPYPCYDGIELTMELYDSPRMRRFEATDFYDDSMIRELVESGFVAATYAEVRARTSARD
jgi:ABC-type nitrate/sulfonate/bicarbonate transport system substrate-binding protein